MSYQPKWEDLTLGQTQVILSFEFDCSQYVITFEQREHEPATFHIVVTEPAKQGFYVPAFHHVKGHLETHPTLHPYIKECGHPDPGLIANLLKLILARVNLQLGLVELPNLEPTPAASEPS